jgi:transcription elongation factor Elf1|tara:strand:- start:1339 stop:1569 length:231 start_codon:yes stop_codon:yes gene_type:complete
MEKLKTKKKLNTICPRCNGNGFIKVPNKSVEELNKEVTMNCTMCESEGELEGEIYGPFDEDKDTIIIDSNGVHRLQ